MCCYKLDCVCVCVCVYVHAHTGVCSSIICSSVGVFISLDSLFALFVSFFEFASSRHGSMTFKVS